MRSGFTIRRWLLRALVGRAGRCRLPSSRRTVAPSVGGHARRALRGTLRSTTSSNRARWRRPARSRSTRRSSASGRGSCRSDRTAPASTATPSSRTSWPRACTTRMPSTRAGSTAPLATPCGWPIRAAGAIAAGRSSRSSTRRTRWCSSRPPTGSAWLRVSARTGAWGFFLHAETEQRTRFLVRSSGGPVGTHAFDLLHFVMEQKMMRGLRDRAEAAEKVEGRATSPR